MKQTNNRKTKWLSMLLAGLMLLSLCPVSVFAAEEVGVEVDIHLRSAEDLRKLATRCQAQGYSAGMVISLDQDIDLASTDFQSIPSFSGTFLGNGHVIKNFNCTANGSHQGLFRYLGSSGSVLNLRVEGSVVPGGIRCDVGGIVGTNDGFVGNCTFIGNVEGLLNVGGIVGENYGIVKDCTMKGTVSGKHFAGGIVGYNEGSVGYCSNEASINVDVLNDSLSLEALQIDDLLGLKDLTEEQIDTTSDIGGVVGISTGIIKACENSGAVGYQFYGYNIGGVAGRQSGYMVDCKNSGPVLGRKDVGGIVGQMTPYLILESSTSMGDELSALQDATDVALNNLDDNSSVVGDAFAQAATYGIAISDNYYHTSETIDKVLSGDELTKEDFLVDDPGSGKKDQTAHIDMGELFQETAETVGEYGEVLTGETIGDIVRDKPLTQQDRENIGATAEKGITDIVSKMEERKAAREAAAAQEAADKARRDQEINDAINASRDLGGGVASAISQLSDDLAGVSQHYNNILSMIANGLTGNYEITILNDVSDDDTADMKDGKVENCYNSGTVGGEADVGGISGSMDTELDFDIEKIMASIASTTTDDVEELATSTYYCRNILTGCINDGVISGRKENVGGVVGVHSIGNVLLSQNYGDVTGNGDYYGGVAGRSTSAIRRCFAMCTLEGNSYIGGVTGQGKVIEDCSTIVTTDLAAACSGSIAGWVDLNNEATCILNNYFVNEDMGGIDGISYDGVCERVTYDKLLTMKALPGEFRQLKLTFMVDGEELKTINFTYGDSLTEDQIPDVPAKGGVTGVWEPFDYENMRRSQVVNAQYNPRQTVLASQETWEDTLMSLVLLEGTFAKNTELELQDYEGDAALPRRGKRAVVLTISGTNSPKSQYTVRWNTGGVRSRAYVLQDGVWQKVPVSMDGHYCVFTCQGKSNTVCVVKRLFATAKK